jgi:hypothetical protein
MRYTGHMERKGGEDRWVEGVGGEAYGKQMHLEDLDIDGKIILNWI